MPLIPFSLERAWCLGDQVELRPEPFGALAYNFATRRLTFLKTTTLFDVVCSLHEHATAREACVVAGVAKGEMPVYERALASLADGEMIRPRAEA